MSKPINRWKGDTPFLKAVKLQVKSKKTYYEASEDGSEQAPDPKVMLLEEQDIAVLNALNELTENRTIEPLLRQFEQFNPAIFRFPQAVEALAKQARGKSVIGKGRKTTKTKQEQNRLIYQTICELKKYGVPIKGDPQKQTACKMVAEKVNLSPEQVYTLWKNENKKSALSMYYYTPWSIQQFNVTPTPDEIIEYFTTGKFREPKAITCLDKQDSYRPKKCTSGLKEHEKTGKDLRLSEGGDNSALS